MSSQPTTPGPGPGPCEATMSTFLREVLREVVEQNEGWPVGEQAEVGDVADYLAFSPVEKVIQDLARQLAQRRVRLPDPAEAEKGR